MPFKKIWISGFIGAMLGGSIAYLTSSEKLPHTSQTTPHLIIQTGEKLYDGVVFNIFQEEVRTEAESSGETDQRDSFEKFSKNDFYGCSSWINEGGWNVHSCNNITGTYYNFDVPEWGLRIGYHGQTALYFYEGSGNNLFPEPKIEEWYLSGNTLYGDNIFFLSYFNSGAKNDITYPDFIEYKGDKFFNTERNNKSGKQYETLPKEGKYKKYARVSFITHQNKDYYYMLFQELRECGPFCGIDHHSFNFFLK